MSDDSTAEGLRVECDACGYSVSVPEDMGDSETPAVRFLLGTLAQNHRITDCSGVAVVKGGDDA